MMNEMFRLFWDEICYWPNGLKGEWTLAVGSFWNFNYNILFFYKIFITVINSKLNFKDKSNNNKY